MFFAEMLRASRPMRVGLLLAGAFCVGVASQTDAHAGRAPVGTHVLPQGDRHWQGWIELTPAIATPESGDDLTRVFATFPPTDRIRLTDSHDRGSLRVPPGTMIDRVELRRVGGTFRVIDVRGTSFDDNGGEVFRAYRALHTGPGAPLIGVSWPRQDLASEAQARSAMRHAMEHGAGVVGDGLTRARTVERYQRLLDCRGCHQINAVEHDRGGYVGPRRPTDASGLYSLLATLTDESVVETYRPHDRNRTRAGIRYQCRDGSVARTNRGFQHLACADGAVPRARLDVAVALKAGDPRALKLCESRRALAAFLHEEVRRQFAVELAACGAAH
ncbi:MAG: hypothetical protein RLZZ450_6703 [Pseudomonadota bacterium]|jgi:hypothetical protein